MRVRRIATTSSVMQVANQSSELTVVFTTHNRGHLIDESLAALAQQDWDGDWEIVLVDNDSSDDTPTVLRSWAERMPVDVQVVNETAGHGPSYSRNAGVRNSKGVNVAFVDDDDLVSPGWVAAIGEALREYELVGSRHDFELLNPPVLAATRTNQLTELGRFYGLPVVSGGGLGVRRELWELAGGSNQSFRTGQDIDFAIRLGKVASPTATMCQNALYHMRLRDGALDAFEQGERFGRAWVRLHAEHDDVAVGPSLSLRQWARRWVALGLRIRKLNDPAQRIRWSFDVGYEVGRVTGAIRYRRWAAA